MNKIIQTLARDCTVGNDCPAVHETDETGGHLVQGYTVTDQVLLVALGAQAGEIAVLLSRAVLDQLAVAGVSTRWLRITANGIPAAVGAAVPNADDLLAGIGRTLPVGEQLVIPRSLQEAIPC